MTATTPGNDSDNQFGKNSCEDFQEKNSQNEAKLTFTGAIRDIAETKPDLFEWLLNLFQINIDDASLKQEKLENAVTNPQKILEIFDAILQQKKDVDREKNGFKNEINKHFTIRNWLLKLLRIESNETEKEDNELEKALYNPQIVLEAFSQINKDINNLERNQLNVEKFNDILRQKSQENQTLQAEIQRLKRGSYNTTQLQAKIEKLEREKQELEGRVSSLLAKLGERDRDKTSTITSDDSRRQRDLLTQDFIQLNNQYFTAVSNEIFNYQYQSNPTLIQERKLEIARIKSVLSRQILKPANKEIIKKIQSDNVSSAVQLISAEIFQELKMPETSPKEIAQNVENLVEKGLKLIKDILNDDPPGELLIESEGTTFSPEIHQPVPGCEAGGKILYTTYPGYRINDRILSDALKAFVFTVPDEFAQSAKLQAQTNDDIYLQNFCGRVTVPEGVYYRNSRKLEDKSAAAAFNGQLINFDASAEGQMVENKDTGEKSSRWFRVADIKPEQWLPKVYIDVNHKPASFPP